MFYPTLTWDASCPGIKNPGSTWDNMLERDTQNYWPHIQTDPSTKKPTNYLGYLQKYVKGRIGWQPNYVASSNDPTKKLLMMFNNVYDVSAYFTANQGFFDDNMAKIFNNYAGKDATALMQSLISQNPVYYKNVLNCMNTMFYIGTVDNRNSLRCQLSNYILLGASVVIVLVICVKFIAALF